MNKRKSYNEDLLHWIWANRYLTRSSPVTTDGKAITVHEPGRPNSTDGPDFLNARISIGRLTFYGDVEMHWKVRDWYRHSHHEDENYNKVILHVVFDSEDQQAVTRPDQTDIPTLCMKPFLDDSLRDFFEQFQQPTGLPCTGNISFISPEAFAQQLEKAHKEYFDQKVNDLLRFYDPDLPISQAWQKLIITALFDGLGITHNREPMRYLAQKLIKKYPVFDNKQQLISYALKQAGIQPETKDVSFNWKRKGSRPNNHPRHRIVQGCELLWYIQHTSLMKWLHTDVRQSFEQCIREIEYQPGLGQSRAGIVFGTVWLPGIYILGDLLHDKKSTSAAYDAWLNHRITLPSSITRLFKQAGIPPSTFQKKLGAVHQLRAYCRPGKCRECKVFKHAISS